MNFKCECCGKIMLEKFGSGRFCSRSCANTRAHSAETKNKISDSLQKYFKLDSIKKYQHTSKNTGRKYYVYFKYTCNGCGKALPHKPKTGFCKECLRKGGPGEAALNNILELCNKAKEEHCSYSGWQSRNLTSFSERFWLTVLNNNSIPYEREFSVPAPDKRHYFLDFKLEKNNKFVDLEIDGKQHTYPERAELDKIRDVVVSNLGYIVYRIAWNEIKSDQGKQQMKEKIDKFLEFYNNL